jgi:hypothetical protein
VAIDLLYAFAAHGSLDDGLMQPLVGALVQHCGELAGLGDEYLLKMHAVRVAIEWKERGSGGEGLTQA